MTAVAPTASAPRSGARYIVATTSVMLLQASCASAFAAASPPPILSRPSFTTILHAPYKFGRRAALQTHTAAHLARCSAPRMLRMNAAVVPLYRGLAAASVLHGCFVKAPLVDASVLVATAIAASVDLGPAAARQIASAVNAQMQTPGAAANKWFALVSMKTAGQILGLLLSAFGAALLGASCIIAADALFWMLGGGAARFGADGPAPIPANLSRVLLGINAIILLATFTASTSPPGLRRAGGAAVYSAGILIQTVGNEKTRKKKASTGKADLTSSSAAVAAPAEIPHTAKDE